MSNSTIFLSYAREDLHSARRLYKALRLKDISVWFDKESLLPGEQFDPSIIRAIRQSRYFLALLSSTAIAKVGYVNIELYEALEQSKRYPPDVAYLLPVRLDDCTPSHERLRAVQYVDLFDGWKTGVDRLVRVAAPRPEAPILRTDGLYVAETEDDRFRFHNLRFFDDGRVVAVSSDWLPDQLAPHMTLTSPHMAIGKCTARGTRVEFSTTSRSGVVDYGGHMTPETLVLRKSSHINHHRDVHEYSFKKVAILSESLGAPPSKSARKGTHRKRTVPFRER